MEETDSISLDRKSSSDLEFRLGYSFSNLHLLDQALTHRSYAVESGPDALDNERLEFLGDAVLELAVSRLLFDRHATCSEGELTKMRSFLVNEGQLASLARELDLGSYLFLGKGEDRSGGREKSSILADSFEAVIGAIYLDGGFQRAFGIIEKCFGSRLVQAVNGGLAADFKSMLQELTQARFHRIPLYKIEDVSGPDHDRTYHVALLFDGNVVARGTGRSKKEAEQKAAGEALAVFLGQIS